MEVLVSRSSSIAEKILNIIIGKNWYFSSGTALFYAEFVVLKTINLPKDLKNVNTHSQDFTFVEKHPASYTCKFMPKVFCFVKFLRLKWQRHVYWNPYITLES